jgi:hypothetical protein
MKAAETKPAAKPASKATPFFSKENGESFFGGNASEQTFFSKTNTIPGIQPKLTIGQPNDKYEQEADAMADKVVQRLSNPGTVQTKPVAPAVTPLIQPKCTACEQEEKLPENEAEEEKSKDKKLLRKPGFGSNPEPPEDEKPIQRKCAECEKEANVQAKGRSKKTSAAATLENDLAAAKGSGSPLPTATRQQMEGSFGVDLSTVKVHTDGSAVQMSQRLNAQAFTHGSNIYFNNGKYDPGSAGGRHLLAHELTHTIQQGAVKGLPATKNGASQAAGNHHQLHAQLLQMKGTLVQLQADIAGHTQSLMAQKSPDLQTDLLDDVAGLAGPVLGSFSELFGIEIPTDPLEALEAITKAAEKPAVRLVIGTIPGLNVVILQLRLVLTTVRLIQEVLDKKEEIIESVKKYFEGQLRKAPDQINAALTHATGIDANHLFILQRFYFPDAFEKLLNTDWWAVLKDVLWQQLWPFEGITTVTEPDPNNRVGLGRDLAGLWEQINKTLSALGNFEISLAADSGLMVMRSLTGIVSRFYGWIALIIVAVEGVLGGIAGAAAGGVGAVPGFVAGAGAGLATADVIGMALLAASVATELAIVIKSGASLFPVHEALADPEKAKRNHEYYTLIAQSSISLGIMGVFALLAWLAGKAAAAIVKRLAQYLPANYQKLLNLFLESYANKRASLLGKGGAPQQGGGGSGGGPGKTGSTGGSPGASEGAGKTFQPVVLEGGGGSKGGTKNLGGGSYPTSGSTALEPQFDPQIEAFVNPNIPNPNPKFPAYLQPVPDLPPLTGAVKTPAPLGTPGVGIGSQTGKQAAEKVKEDKADPAKKCFKRSIYLMIQGFTFVPIGAGLTPEDLRVLACLQRTLTGTTDNDFTFRNIAVGRFIVNGRPEYVAAPNPERDIHSEDEVFRLAEIRFGKNNFTLDALFTERRPCPRCTGNIFRFPRTPGFLVYCIINNDYNWRQIRDSYNEGIL